MLYAKFVNPNAGMKFDPEQCRNAGLKLGERYRVSFVDMFSWYTDICLEEYGELRFNSVHFDFDEDGEPIDIYCDPRYNPYMEEEE